MDPYILILWIHILLLCGPAKWLAMTPHTNFNRTQITYTIGSIFKLFLDPHANFYWIHILRFSGPTIIFVVIVEPHEQRQHDRLAPDYPGGRR